MLKQFDRARLHYVAEYLFRQAARLTPSDGHDLDHLLPFLVVHQKRRDAAVSMLDAIRILNGNTQSDGDVLREVKAAEWEHCGMLNRAATEDHDARYLGTDVNESASVFFIVIRKNAFGCRERLKHHSLDIEARPPNCLVQVLPACTRASNDMDK
jgi:hypothetical protein